MAKKGVAISVLRARRPRDMRNWKRAQHLFGSGCLAASEEKPAKVVPTRPVNSEWTGRDSGSKKSRNFAVLYSRTVGLALAPTFELQPEKIANPVINLPEIFNVAAH